MRLNLFLSVLLFCAVAKAQTPAELKAFINKNNVALRGVQKNMIRENNNSYTANFKDLIKNQEAAVKLYNTDQKASMHFAYLVRIECLVLLKKYSLGSTEYFEMSVQETSFSRSLTDNSKALSLTEIKKVDDLDCMNPQSLNSLTLTVQ
ncbi:MAG: hypothetical protein V4580_11770 [Bacteroidota bacterium]